MPIPASITDLSKVASENSPAGTETAKGTIDDYLRAGFAFTRQMYDLLLGPTVTLPSAATVNIGFAASNSIAITGTTTITAFDSIAEGTTRWVTFGGALTLTHNAASLQLPGAANIVTTAGDVALFKSLGAGNWKCMAYQRISGTGPVVASAAADGYLSKTDWAAFNAKLTPAAAAAAYLALSGSGTMTGPFNVNVTASNPYGTAQFINTAGPMRIFLQGDGASGIKVLRVTGGTFAIRNNADNADCLTVTESGTVSAPVITETSDERKKKSWRKLPSDLIERMAGIRKAGTFRWKKDNVPAVGIGAQSLEAIIPEAVYTDDEGGKAVNTGGAAMAIIPELCRELMRLRARLDQLEAR